MESFYEKLGDPNISQLTEEERRDFNRILHGEDPYQVLKNYSKEVVDAFVNKIDKNGNLSESLSCYSEAAKNIKEEEYGSAMQNTTNAKYFADLFISDMKIEKNPDLALSKSEVCDEISINSEFQFHEVSLEVPGFGTILKDSHVIDDTFIQKFNNGEIGLKQFDEKMENVKLYLASDSNEYLIPERNDLQTAFHSVAFLDKHEKYEIANNPDSSKELLSVMLYTCDVTDPIRNSILNNPNADLLLLNKIDQQLIVEQTPKIALLEQTYKDNQKSISMLGGQMSF